MFFCCQKAIYLADSKPSPNKQWRICSHHLLDNMEYSCSVSSPMWIPQQSEEEVMTQEGVIAQLAVKASADDPTFPCFSYLRRLRQAEVCFPLFAQTVSNRKLLINKRSMLLIWEVFVWITWKLVIRNTVDKYCFKKCTGNL